MHVVLRQGCHVLQLVELLIVKILAAALCLAPMAPVQAGRLQAAPIAWKDEFP